MPARPMVFAVECTHLLHSGHPSSAQPVILMEVHFLCGNDYDKDRWWWWYDDDDDDDDDDADDNDLDDDGCGDDHLDFDSDDHHRNGYE